jgi:hypothetical protein
LPKLLVNRIHFQEIKEIIMNSKTRQSKKPAKSAKSSKPSSASIPAGEPIAKGTSPDQQTDPSQPNLARVHDLKSIAVMSIPEELRSIFGDEAYEHLVKELEQYEMVFVMRTASDVVYIRASLFAVDSKPVFVFPEELGKTSAPKKAKAKAKSKTVKRSTKPAV